MYSILLFTLCTYYTVQSVYVHILEFCLICTVCNILYAMYLYSIIFDLKKVRTFFVHTYLLFLDIFDNMVKRLMITILTLLLIYQFIKDSY